MSKAEDPQNPVIPPIVTDEAPQGNSAAPQPQSDTGSPDDVEALKRENESLKKSQKDLLSQRDREANARQNGEAFLGEIAQERQIDAFLAANKDKYPDLERDDLMFVDDPEFLEAAATRLQNKISTAAQNKLLEIQNPTVPKLTPEERVAQEQALMKNGVPVKGAFQQFLRLKQS